ncbi:MAG TPA: translation initiation factor IF-2 N-terminal domain-containing protein, partial [Acidimicrobiia bacterium]|nr:translation initiation factor IF-2 N-terminal domain-containing protein [Acidimicrobiia bacterium]
MAKLRIYELARELGLESKEVLDHAHELGIEAKTASSSIEETDADVVRLAIGEAKAPAVVAEPEPEPEPEPEAPPREVRVVTVPANASVAQVAEALGESPGEIVKALMSRGVLIGAGAPMPQEHLDAVAEQFAAMVEVEAPP